MNRPALCAGLVAAACFCVQPASAQRPANGGPQPREVSPRTAVTRAVLSLTVEASANGETFDVDVTAADDRGIDSLEIRAGSETMRVLAGGLRRISRSFAIPPPRDLVDAWVQVVVVDVDGTRGAPVTKFFAVPSEHRSTPDPTEVEQGLERLLDVSYRPQTARGKTIALPIDDRPWWIRWHEKGGPDPFDYKSQCPQNQQVMNPFGSVLECWLDLHPNVKNAIVWEALDPDAGPIDANGVRQGVVTTLPFKDWDANRRFALYGAFYWAWKWMQGGLVTFEGEPIAEIAPNKAFLDDNDGTLTVLGVDDAWRLYVQTIGHSLAVEIGGFVPWTIVNYNDKDLELLFSSKKTFSAGYWSWTSANTAQFRSVTGYALKGWSLPAPPTTNFQFLVTHDAIRSSDYHTVGGLVKWTRVHLQHTGSAGSLLDGRDAISAQTYWGYRGMAPAARLMQGTTYVYPYDDLGVSEFVMDGHFVFGCYGMAYFLQGMLHAVNIPVDTYVGNIGQTGHTAPIFHTIGYAMSHGDDVNNGSAGTYEAMPAVPAHRLLLPKKTYWEWFYSGMMIGDGTPNVGRQTKELALEYLSNKLVTRYCWDQALKLQHWNGWVWQFFWVGNDQFYTVPQLEAMQLWERLKDKAAKLGYCGN